MSQPAFMCSRAAHERDDSMVATAPPAQRWLLIEQEGAWPINALDAFPTNVARRIAARAAAADARVSLIRRPGRHPREDRPIRWAFADVRPSNEGIRWGEAASAADLLDMPWEVSPGEGEPVAIVCAHSRHDVCCAMKGRPVAQSLTDQWPGRVWECSHLGGDRFAATMVLLPTGLCFGRITVDNAGAVLDAYEQGRVVPDLLRGRCAYTRQEQAAQSLARAQGFGSDRIDALIPLGTTVVDHATFQVTLAANPSVTVRARESTVPLGTPATCRSTLLAEAREYAIVGTSLLDSRPEVL